MSDTVHDLTHDHHEINHYVITVSAIARKLELDVSLRVAFTTALSELRELLFLHFAREEEGLFPFIANALPEFADRATAMASAHDAICGALVRTVHLASTASVDESAAIIAMYERFALAYSSHATSEAALLGELAERLDPAQRAALAAVARDL